MGNGRRWRLGNEAIGWQSDSKVSGGALLGGLKVRPIPRSVALARDGVAGHPDGHPAPFRRRQVYPGVTEMITYQLCNHQFPRGLGGRGMAGRDREHRAVIWAAVIGALGAVIAAVVAAVITVSASPSGGNTVDQKTGQNGTVCIESTCR